MTTKKKKTWFILSFMIMGLVSFAHSGDVDRIGSAAGAQVQQPVGAKDIAMSGANIALTSGINAIYWNPAGLSRMDGNAMGQFSTLTIFDDIKINYLAVGASLGDLGTLAFSIKAFDFGDIPLTTNEDMDGASGKTFSPTFATSALTYAIGLTNTINVGLTAKVIYESVPRAEGTAIAFDAGLQYANFGGLEGLSFGIAIKNIGSDMRYEGSAFSSEFQAANGRQDVLDRTAASNQLPGSFEFGVGYVNNINEQSAITLNSMFQSNNFDYDAVKMGLEYSYDKMLFLRGGYNMSDAPEDSKLYTFTMGAGFKYDVGGTVIMVDYAFRDSKYFDANNIFSLTLGF